MAVKSAAREAPAQPARSFDGAQKAAIILIALGNEIGAGILQGFEPAELKQIIAGANAIGSLEKSDLELLINEFADRFARATSVTGDSDKVRSLMESAFPGGKLDSLLSGPQTVRPEPVWGSFRSGGENLLAPYLLDQHPQVVAFILSKLDGQLTAKLLLLLPRRLRASVAGRLLKMQPVGEIASGLVEDCLRADLLGARDPGQDREARKRVAAIINEMSKTDADAILDDLARSRPEDARALKALLFAFEDVVRLDAKSLSALFDKVPAEQVIPALRGSGAEMKTAVLAALGARARRMVEGELARSDEPGADGIAARRSIVQLALALAATGDVALPQDEAGGESAAAA